MYNDNEELPLIQFNYKYETLRHFSNRFYDQGYWRYYLEGRFSLSNMGLSDYQAQLLIKNMFFISSRDNLLRSVERDLYQDHTNYHVTISSLENLSQNWVNFGRIAYRFGKVVQILMTQIIRNHALTVPIKNRFVKLCYDSERNENMSEFHHKMFRDLRNDMKHRHTDDYY